jgi:uncharacterized membrane protein YvbJ
VKDVTEFDEKHLAKSYTYTKWKAKCGRCNECQEMTEVLYPCCNATVSFEGSSFDSDILWDKIENELVRLAEPDIDAELKDGGLL